MTLNMSVLRSSLRFAITLRRSQALPSPLLIGGSSCARSRSWAVPCLVSLLALSLLCTFPASAQYPGGGYFGGYPGSDGTGYQMTSQTGGQSVIHQDGQTRTIPYSATSSGYAGGVVTG